MTWIRRGTQLVHVLAGVASVLACACRPRAADTPGGATAGAGAPTWGVTPEAAGPVRFGMTATEASSAVGGAAANAAPTDSACRYWVPQGAPAGLRLMLENGLVVRADVDSAGIRTISNLGVGSPVESVVVALGPSLQVSPHKYQWEEGWRYLSFGDDSTHRLIFTVDSHVVRSWRAGLVPAVEYVEGCS
jgi:hypothetical protein